MSNHYYEHFADVLPDPRVLAVKKKELEDAATEGYAIYAGIKPEFIVMKWDDKGRPVKAYDDNPQPGHGVRSRRQVFGYDVEYSLHDLDVAPAIMAGRDSVIHGILGPG